MKWSQTAQLLPAFAEAPIRLGGSQLSEPAPVPGQKILGHLSSDRFC